MLRIFVRIETLLESEPRFDSSVSVIGAESNPRPLLDNVLHDGRDGGQQARQRKPMQSPPRKRLRADLDDISPDRSQPTSWKDALMESQASASAIDPALLNALSCDEDAPSASTHTKQPAPNRNLDEAIPETAEESRLLFATKKTFNIFTNR